jgi:hypothetical protein
MFLCVTKVTQLSRIAAAFRHRAFVCARWRHALMTSSDLPKWATFHTRRPAIAAQHDRRAVRASMSAMARVPSIRPTEDENGGARSLLVLAALVVAAWAVALLASGWWLFGP